jgi:MFS transporter, LPLT family, lysophospholipid transporter
MESSTIAAILAGAILGGTLADWSVPGCLAVVAGCYAAAAAANLLIPKLPAAHPFGTFSFGGVFRDFIHATRTLVKNPDARFSMAGTSLFWGAGATLRFLLVAWVPIALGIMNNSMPAYLNATVAVGIVVGAGLAAKFVSLERADRVLPAGVLIGVTVCLLAGTTHVPMAFAVMTALGACGGFFIVPLNALLQERGHQTVGTGHAVAVQNLVENATMLLMLGIYTVALRANASITAIAMGFGAMLSLAIGGLWVHRARRRAPLPRAL